ncbi:hypothetical protein KKA00_11670 [bacterium]|nr:hypothetical protein [bacterium]
MSNRIAIVFLSFCLTFNLANLCYAQTERGITNEISPDHLGSVGTDLAVIGIPENLNLLSGPKYSTPGDYQLDDWMLTFSDTLSFFIPQSDYLAVRFDPLTADVSYISSYSGISEIQQQAIDRAPAWLAADLEDNFRRFLYSFVADDIAQVILDTPDPYVDEVAFECAHIAPDILGAMYYDLLPENVEDVYAVDDSLHFVDIVDHGDSNDDDYYTSVVYTVIEENGDTIEYELEKEYYYWYNVHPKLSDEAPTYISPTNGQVAPPPWGYFWRDYLWNYADEGYPLYSEIWSDVEIYWDRSDTGTDAIDVMNQWIDDVMDFGAGNFYLPKTNNLLMPMKRSLLI